MTGPVVSRVRGLWRLRRAVELVLVSARGPTLAGWGLTVVQAALPLAALCLIKMAVDAVADGLAGEPAAALPRVLLLILLTGGVTLAGVACRAVADLLREHQAELVTDHVTDRIHRQSAALDLAYYEDPQYHDTLHRAQQEALFRPARIVQSLAQLVQNAFFLMALAGLLVYLHWGVAVVLFVVVLPGIAVKIWHADRLHAWRTRRAATERRAADFHALLTSGAQAQEVRLFDLAGVFRQRYRALRADIRRERLALARSRGLFDLAAQAGATTALYGMLALIAWQVLQGRMTIGDMVLYHQAFQRAQGALQEILTSLAGLYESSLFFHHLTAFLDLTPRLSTCPSPAPVPRPWVAGVALEGVWFRYPGSDRDVLRGVDLRIGPGQVVALVGENGAGKTTLAKLLGRLYDPTAGRLTLDGVPFPDFDPQALRRDVAMILQDFTRYPLTVRENIWVGDTRLDPSDERVAQAARRSGAEGFIPGLPLGYETLLGKRYTDGVEISVGQWQQVALARAFLRDARLIVLDEPTSAMSARAESELFESFRALLGGRSALLISHRFSTVRMADLICVLDGGRVVERGTHSELMALGGWYARMYDLQARWYP